MKNLKMYKQALFVVCIFFVFFFLFFCFCFLYLYPYFTIRLLDLFLFFSEEFLDWSRIFRYSNTTSTTTMRGKKNKNKKILFVFEMYYRIGGFEIWFLLLNVFYSMICQLYRRSTVCTA